jgi:signal transduction histidine kinase
MEPTGTRTETRAPITKLLEAVVDVASGRTVDDVTAKALEAARAITGAPYGAAFLMEEGRIVSSRTIGFLSTHVDVLRDKSFLETVLEAVRHGEDSVQIDHVVHPRSSEDPLERITSGALLGVPILHGHTLAGIFYLMKLPGEPSFTAEDRTEMAALARQTAAALRFARSDEQAREATTRVGLLEERWALTKNVETRDNRREYFANTISHEVRGSLGVIVGFASTLVDRWDSLPDEQRREFTEKLAQEARKLLHLSENLIDVMTLGRADHAEVEGPQDVHDLILQAVDEARAALEGEGREAPEVAVDVAEGLEAQVQPEYLKEVVTQYLANAFAHGESPISVTARAEDGWVNIHVIDEGPGVPDHWVTNLFQRPTSQRKGSGRGMGLFIIGNLARVQGGQAWYEHNEPRGARFCVRFPQA